MDHTHPGTCPDCPETCEVCEGTGEVYEMTFRKIFRKGNLAFVFTDQADMRECPRCTPREPDPDEKHDRIQEGGE